MADKNVQETLDRILASLKSDNPQDQVAAIHELETINVSSEAIVLQLEKLVIQKTNVVREAALRALRLKTTQFVVSKRTPLNRSSRAIILREIDIWQENSLLEPHVYMALQRRYDFDIEPGIPVRPVTLQVEENAEQVIEKKEPVQIVAPKPAVVTSQESTHQQIKPAEPRPSLTQVLLSENSIRVYLYLGAFFVIASAAILAAVIEAARAPILLIATLIFAGGAVGIKKRLPQPSFALAVVFSFLLPIDANVISDSLLLNYQVENFYWAGILLLMTIVWGFGTWFYESRMFSLVAFFAFLIGLYRFNVAVDVTADWVIFTIGFANMLGLIFIRLIHTWKDKKFAQPLFITIQASQVIVMFMSLTYVGINLFNSNVAPNAWIAHTLTWTFAASFFAASNLLAPLVFFPWIAAASLFPIPSLFLAAFDASAVAQIIGFGVWGAVMAFASEFAKRTQNAEFQKYHYPLLTLSLPLMSFSVLRGLTENNQTAFAALISMGIVYTIINILRARWYVWSVALLAWLSAFFLFFTLPFMQKTEVYFDYQLLIASVALLIPELFMNKPLTIKRTWNWPPVTLGTILASLNIILVHLALLENNFGRAAITLGVYTLLFAAYALHFKQTLIGYLATTSLALTVIYALVHFDLDLWLPSLTALSVIYYLAGYFISRNKQNKAWGKMLINSGLTLGTILSTVALFTLKATGGWYAIIIGALYLVEMFTRRNSYLELFAVVLSGAALILILNDFKVYELSYYLFGLGLLWLAGDVVLHYTFDERKTDVITHLVGGFAVLLFVFDITSNNGLASSAASACFAVYTIFFAAYALAYKKPVLGYLSTASAAATMFYALDHFKIEVWLPIFTGLSLAYYVAGYFIQNKNAGWAEMFRYSGLSLGSIVSFVALFGLEPTGGWYAIIVGVLFTVETVSKHNGWFEAGIHILFSIAAFLILNDFKINESSYILLALSLVWLGGDVILHKIFTGRKIANFTRIVGVGITIVNMLTLLDSRYLEATIGFGIYAVFFAAYGLLYKEPLIGYASTISLPLAVYYGLQAAGQERWLFPTIAVAVVYYAVGFFLRRSKRTKWDDLLMFSGLGLGTITALLAPFQQGGIEKAIPIAIAATLFAVEAFQLGNVWLAFPANGLYLISYFTLLIELNVDQPQYFSIGAALLGMLMHYLLTRAESKTGAFIMGTVSQLVLLGTSYVQLVSTSQVGYFFVLFFQSLVIIFYGLYMRSRSLVFAPIAIVVLATLAILYSALQDLSLVIIIGVSGIVLLTLGILAVLMRERITSFVERFNDWNE